jgi:hypothetical protein
VSAVAPFLHERRECLGAPACVIPLVAANFASRAVFALKNIGARSFPDSWTGISRHNFDAEWNPRHSSHLPLDGSHPTLMTTVGSPSFCFIVSGFGMYVTVMT